MSGTFKVLNGTPVSGKSLCLTCSHMARRIGQNMEEEIHCGSYKFGDSNGNTAIVKFRVAECTEYQPFNSQSLKDMYDIAWTIEAKKRGPVGFGTDGIDDRPLEFVIRPPKSDDNNE